ncbi:A/G-specific adenine glycosylase [Pseudorhodoferax sp. Leaf267]|uniref:A/G-specific adenine glycosylase n=1 Tax=Pseudorhodoferax sp. Leaf267 TaxID=1736316 RepID=UPI0006F2843D|nr:A/G-specific adenine glycosylase [Pseudorhodoferax sp. Leaf267]KQP14282.1 A/G-specific adenine glycosylase [Pseudorhodoferax sp. Leaf267]
MPEALNPCAPGWAAQQVVHWQAGHGRHDLPWQGTRDPYRVWLSEIMLQQTQVAAVKQYFARFVERFPDVQALASASQDEVFALWAGLGYYSRARNLHACAQQVVALHGGRFPASAALLQTLPGIGRSTASAIAAFCFAERVAILDGNVKRVLTRLLGFAGDLAEPRNERALWAQATELLPQDHLADRMPRYTQGVMDLGATVCTARNPSCLICPLRERCVARSAGQPERYPVKTRKLKRSSASWWLLWAEDAQGRIWLTRRPQTGVWAGLHCLPVFESSETLLQALPAPQRSSATLLTAFTHVLTHKDLLLHPVHVLLGAGQAVDAEGFWAGAADLDRLGLPAPVRKLLSPTSGLATAP